MRGKRILVIDDEKVIIESVGMFLSEKGYSVEGAVSATEGREKILAFRPDVVILDIRLPDGSGLDLLDELREANRELPVIMITAFHDMDSTIGAIKRGATEYITKPIDADELERAVARAMKVSGGVTKVRQAVDSGPIYQKGKLVGGSRDMLGIFKAIGALSENRVTVLIEGETGTGKELIARAIHFNSPEKDQPFIAINCSAIVPTLLESELFGHEKGAFTGALSQKKGKFELAGHGTIFLDEVGDIPLELQAKLLRFLQEKEFERVGGERTLHSNARVVAATNRELGRMVQQSIFREDLYYRLSVATVRVPPLRARREDIGLLVGYLLKKINDELRKNVKVVEEKALQMLIDYDWPGNIRELENVLTRAAIAIQGEILFEEVLAPLLCAPLRRTGPRSDDDSLSQSLAATERDYIVAVLKQTKGHLGNACRILGISRPTLRQKLREYSLTEGSAVQR
jgi:two-component system, NtrC family, response regulator AtoC